MGIRHAKLAITQHTRRVVFFRHTVLLFTIGFSKKTVIDSETRIEM